MKETTLNPRRVKEHSAIPPRVRPRALLDPAWVMEGLLRRFREKRGKWRWCTVGRLSARNHLVTGENEGCKEPLKCDGTTRHSREVVEMSRKPGKPWECLRNPVLNRAGSDC
ncbi:hypothetical protein CRG98_019177 [Punica granatum]|uniref:Uncharacterized protein n=1 Tax=Punica granatum TaxID=22663 RepID=A0A2I0JYA6_PUNGR|nr:hypothetical protein CRG98_019177 [Punica granatum]